MLAVQLLFPCNTETLGTPSQRIHWWNSKHSGKAHKGDIWEVVGRGAPITQELAMPPPQPWGEPRYKAESHVAQCILQLLQRSIVQ